MTAKYADIQINKMVSIFEDRLWTGNNCKFYGRVFRNETREGYSVRIQPLIYLSNDDYIEVLADDRKDATCFFDVLPNVVISGNVVTADVRVLFMVNLRELYPKLNRQDATNQVFEDVQKRLSNYKFDITGAVTGYTAFSDYQWPKAVDFDMHPYYLFRFDTKIYYSNC